MILTAALLSLGNCARGQGTKNPDGNNGISHHVWLAYAAFVIGSSMPLHPDQAFMWFLITIIVTMRATGKTLLIGINGDKGALREGFERNLLTIPLLMALHAWWGVSLLLQGLLYYVCGRVFKKDATRYAEGLSGAIIGLCI